MSAAPTSPVYPVYCVPHRLQTPPSQSLFVKFSQKLGPAAPCSLQTWVAICFTLSRSVVGGGFDLVKTLLRTGSEQTKKTIVTGQVLCLVLGDIENSITLTSD